MMPKVTNKSGKGVPLNRYRVLPDSRVLNREGKVVSALPADVAFSPRAKRLHEEGVLEIEGLSKSVKAVAKEEAAKVTTPTTEDPAKTIAEAKEGGNDAASGKKKVPKKWNK